MVVVAPAGAIAVVEDSRGVWGVSVGEPEEPAPAVEGLEEG